MELEDEFGEPEGALAVLETPQPEEPEEVYPTFKVWKDAGRAIEKEHGDYRWKVGDWLLAGEKEFGKKAYKEAAAITGYKRVTLYDLARVAKRVPTSVRTEVLSWNHHRAVEELEPEAQKEWLRQAHAANLSVAALRKDIKRQPLPGHPPRPITEDRGSGERIRNLRVGLIESDIEVVEKLAAARKVTPGELLRDVVVQYLRKPETAAELEKAKMHAEMVARENRRAAREKWQKETILSIEALLERFSDVGLTPDISDFVAEWEDTNNSKFPFDFAMKHTEFRAHYHGMSKEDASCGKYERVRSVIKR